MQHCAERFCMPSHIRCVWLGGQPLAWISRAKFGMFGYQEVGWGLARAGHPYPFSMSRTEHPNRSFNWSQAHASLSSRFMSPPCGASAPHLLAHALPLLLPWTPARPMKDPYLVLVIK
jgi:hypothetical protein